ncbi:uncharacterized protein LOC135080901 [Ostrinia nubilalis]|uniref:uncharacterized protein LOC135080901 n=1 Tax=Ostrinia nubilalis TaxID=29057 RepID=UPI0030824E2F
MMVTRDMSRSLDHVNWWEPEHWKNRKPRVMSSMSLEGADPAEIRNGWLTLPDPKARFQQKQMQERELKIASLYEAQQARALDRVRHSPGTGHGTTSPPQPPATITHHPGKVRQMFEERRTKAGIDKSYPLQPIHNTERNPTRKALPNGYTKVTATANSKVVEKRTTKTHSHSTHTVKKQQHKIENIVNGSGDLNHNHEPDLNRTKHNMLPKSNGELISRIDELDKADNNYLLEDETFPEALAPTPTPRSPEPREVREQKPQRSYPDFEKEFNVTTDASHFAIGAVLSQGPIGSDKPIAFASRTLNDNEVNYSTTEKELLAIVWATKYFRPYLFGRKFKIVTDHKPLQWLVSLKEPNSRLTRWKLKLAEFDYEVVYKKGTSNTNADALSRVVINNNETESHADQPESTVPQSPRTSEVLEDILSLIGNVSEIPDVDNIQLDQLQDETVHTNQEQMSSSPREPVRPMWNARVKTRHLDTVLEKPFIDEMDKADNNYLLEDETFPEALAPTPTPRSPEPREVREQKPQRSSPAPRNSPPKTKPQPTAAPPRRVTSENAVSDSSRARGAMQRTANASPTKPRGTASAASASAAGSAGAGAACAVCGRRFAPDRLHKHQDICKKAHAKKRKPFDALKHRLAGTEAENYKGTEAEPFISKLRKGAASSNKVPTAKPLNNNWRQKHEEFIQAIRAAKQVQAHLNAGGKLSDLPPPPPSENPDYIQCPHCSRRFNKAAAERHIPKCASFQFNKPKPNARKR